MKQKTRRSPGKDKSRRPRIGITLGDPGGIGPEVVLKALASRKSLPPAHYLILGSSRVVAREKKLLGIDWNPQLLDPVRTEVWPRVSFLEVENPSQAAKLPAKGFPSKENGLASFLYFKHAVQMAGKGVLQAVVTAPISKKSWDLAGIGWLGHTDFLAQSYPQATMVFWSKRMKLALLSHHVSLREALARVSEKNLLRFFLSLQQTLGRIRRRGFEFLVAGLNPHAGEDGLLGNEEQEEVVPAIAKARKKGMDISGPYPPDVVFRHALDKPDKFVIALFHDQGLIPFKLVSFESGVNLSLGLPFVRTSPDHGTAFDIAGKGLADPRSLVEAIRLAWELSTASF